MVRHVNEILRDSIAIAEEQVEAARRLDVAALTESTGFREDLVTELAQAVDAEKTMSNGGNLPHDTEELAFQLSELDTRLETLLGAGLTTLEKLRGARSPDTYTFEGRLKGSTP
jgi:hypothetical protein